MVSDSALTSAYSLINEGRFREAKALLEDALSTDLDDHNICFAASCCSFWIGAVEHSDAQDGFENGEHFVNQWRIFKLRISANEKTPPLESTIHAFRKWVFTVAFNSYMESYGVGDEAVHSEVCRKLGLCKKQLGDFESALQFFTESNNLVAGRADILAEMADCYELCGEDKVAKAIFREAFFLDPERVDLSFLESSLIKDLASFVAEKGYSGSELMEWIPVYGTIYSVFDVRRTLRAQEVGKLKQDIYAKENALKDPSNDSRIIVPRLLNMYFWLLDYYDLAGESSSRVDEILLKIKILDRNIYTLYTGGS